MVSLKYDDVNRKENSNTMFFFLLLLAYKYTMTSLIIIKSLNSPAVTHEQSIKQNGADSKNLDEFDIEHGIIDSNTPQNVPLRGQYKKSFAYYTFRQRLPNTLQTVWKSLEETKKLNKLPNSQEELTIIMDLITQLKNQLENDGKLESFKGNGKFSLSFSP